MFVRISPNHPLYRVFIYLLCGGLFVLSLPMVILGVPLVLYERAALGWPTAQGNITISRVSLDPAHAIEVRYDYQVEGKAYEGRRVTQHDGTLKSRDAASLLAEFPAGPATVYYNPEDPAQSLLKPDAGTELLWGLACMVFLFLFSSFGLFRQLGKDLFPEPEMVEADLVGPGEAS